MSTVVFCIAFRYTLYYMVLMKLGGENMKNGVTLKPIAIRIPDTLHKACLKKAKTEQMTFSEWLRNVLSKETKDVRAKTA